MKISPINQMTLWGRSPIVWFSNYHGKDSPFQPAKVPDPFSFVAASI